MTQDPQHIEGVNARQPQKNHYVLIISLAAIAMMGAVLLSPLPRKIYRAFKAKPAPVKKVDEVALAKKIEDKLRKEMEARLKADVKAQVTEATSGFNDRLAVKVADIEKTFRTSQESNTKGEHGDNENIITDVRLLRSGIPFDAKIVTKEGDLASNERLAPRSYTTNYTVNLTLPKPAKTLAEIQKNNTYLPAILPKLPKLLESSELSPYFKSIYQNKITRTSKNATDLNELLTKHNFFDLETILQMRDNASKRRIFFMQAEMDVVCDGSDPDRVPKLPDEIINSDHYQPFTSYAWKKTTENPNPLLASWKRQLSAAKTEARADELRKGIADMQTNSYLIAEYDPFIVIPVNLLTNDKDPYAPKVGDYAVVIHQKQVLPAIVGDGGPTFKVGEASLRIAKQLNPKANPNFRPESNLKVTYLVFPNSRESERSKPDYVKWHDACQKLLDEIGGLGPGYTLFTWTDPLAPPPAPVPAISPTPSPTPAPSTESR